MNGELTQAMLAKALELAPSRITALKKQGMPTTSVEAAQAWRAAYQSIARRKKSERVVVSPPSFQAESRDTFDRARTRREIAEANLSELRESQQRGELIAVAAVESVWARQFVAFRGHLLYLSDRLAPMLAAEKDTTKIAQLLDAEHCRALEYLAASPLPSKEETL